MRRCTGFPGPLYEACDIVPFFSGFYYRFASTVISQLRSFPSEVPFGQRTKSDYY